MEISITTNQFGLLNQSITYLQQLINEFSCRPVRSYGNFITLSNISPANKQLIGICIQESISQILDSKRALQNKKSIDDKESLIEFFDKRIQNYNELLEIIQK